MKIKIRKGLWEFAQRYPDAAGPLKKLHSVVRSATRRSLQEMRAWYPHADPVKVASGATLTVFNIGGNKYRLLALIRYDRQEVYMLRVLTHAEYSSDRWKDSL